MRGRVERYSEKVWDRVIDSERERVRERKRERYRGSEENEIERVG